VLGFLRRGAHIRTILFLLAWVAVGGCASDPVVPAPAPAPGLRSVRVLRLEGDLSLRGGRAQSTPLGIHLGEAEALVLKLFPDVEDLPKDTRAALLIRVLDGETIMLGGFVRDFREKHNNGVPILKDIPLLGALFSSRSTDKKRSELIVLMKPTVLRTPRAKISRPEPSGFMRQIAL